MSEFKLDFGGATEIPYDRDSRIDIKSHTRHTPDGVTERGMLAPTMWTTQEYYGRG